MDSKNSMYLVLEKIKKKRLGIDNSYRKENVIIMK
jgi:hypothetical protein